MNIRESEALVCFSIGVCFGVAMIGSIVAWRGWDITNEEREIVWRVRADQARRDNAALADALKTAKEAAR